MSLDLGLGNIIMKVNLQMRKFEDDLREKEQIIINLKEKFIIGGMAEKKAKVIVDILLCFTILRRNTVYHCMIEC